MPTFTFHFGVPTWYIETVVGRSIPRRHFSNETTEATFSQATYMYPTESKFSVSTLNLSEADLKIRVIIPTSTDTTYVWRKKSQRGETDVFTGYGLNMLHLQELQT